MALWVSEILGCAILYGVAIASKYGSELLFAWLSA
jgi:hypothetical protein